MQQLPPGGANSSVHVSLGLVVDVVWRYAVYVREMDVVCVWRASFCLAALDLCSHTVLLVGFLKNLPHTSGVCVCAGDFWVGPSKHTCLLDVPQHKRPLWLLVLGCECCCIDGCISACLQHQHQQH